MDDARKMRLATEAVEPTPFEIPGATGGVFRIQILNEDQARGVVTSIVHLPPGGRIPAHLHRAGAEMHYLLDGDLIEAGSALAPGAFLTHAAGTVHGPHESRGGARVLTVQGWQSRDGEFDFHLAEENAAGDDPPPHDGRDARAVPAGDGVGGPATAEHALGKGYG